MGKAVFQKWCGALLGDMDEAGEELLTLLDSLPLALAQAALYIFKTKTDTAKYIMFYKQQ